MKTNRFILMGTQSECDNDDLIGWYDTIDDAIAAARKSRLESARLFDNEKGIQVAPFRWKPPVEPPRVNQFVFSDRFYPEFLDAVSESEKTLFIESANKAMRKTSLAFLFSNVTSGGVFINSAGERYNLDQYTHEPSLYERGILSAHVATGIKIPVPLVSVDFQPLPKGSQRWQHYPVVLHDGVPCKVVETLNYKITDKRTLTDLAAAQSGPWWDEETQPWPGTDF